MRPGEQSERISQRNRRNVGTHGAHRFGDALDWLGRRTDSWCRSCNYPAFVRRALFALGWSMARILSGGICDDESAGHALVEAAREWMLAGANAETGRTWEIIHACLFHRCLPELGPAASGLGWWFATTVTSVVLLVHSTRDERVRTRIRMALRCLPVPVQVCLWGLCRQGALWQFTIHHFLGSPSPGARASTDCVYTVIDLSTAVWYIGKTQARRHRISPSLGLAARFREHLLAAFKPVTQRSGDPLPAAWRRSTPHHLCIIPSVWADDGVLESVAHQIIRFGQPSKQTVPGTHRPPRNRRRPWPRFRVRPTGLSEVSCNVLASIYI